MSRQRLLRLEQLELQNNHLQTRLLRAVQENNHLRKRELSDHDDDTETCSNDTLETYDDSNNVNSNMLVNWNQYPMWKFTTSFELDKLSSDRERLDHIIQHTSDRPLEALYKADINVRSSPEEALKVLDEWHAETSRNVEESANTMIKAGIVVFGIVLGAIAMLG